MKFVKCCLKLVFISLEMLKFQMKLRLYLWNWKNVNWNSDFLCETVNISFKFRLFRWNWKHVNSNRNFTKLNLKLRLYEYVNYHLKLRFSLWLWKYFIRIWDSTVEIGKKINSNKGFSLWILHIFYLKLRLHRWCM